MSSPVGGATGVKRFALFPSHGQPGLAPWRLALVTVFQCMEGLTDRYAADSVRDRLGWQYPRSLGLTDPGLAHTLFSELRSRLVEDHAGKRLVDPRRRRCERGGRLSSDG